MSVFKWIMLAFSLLGALDRIFGNRFGLGKEFEKGFMLLGSTALSMIGMIVLSPLIAKLLLPVSNWVYSALGIDPSVIPASLLANDMGGAPLSVQMAKDEAVGMFNALIVSSMMGCTVSYTIPYALGCVRQEKHAELFLGLLCGIVTIPVGCFLAGLALKMPLGALLAALLPLAVFSVLVACGILLIPKLTVKLFSWLGFLIRGVITVGLVLGMLEALADIELIPGLAKMREATEVCLNAVMVLSGAFPLMHLASKVLARPLGKLGGMLGMDGDGAMAFLVSTVTNTASFPLIDKMEKRGIVLNAAFAVSGSFTFGAHLAFTMAMDASYIPAMILGKLVSGIFAVVLAMFVYKRTYKQEEEQ